MLHLDPERLAALADAEPTADEALHLAACDGCAQELRAHWALLALASRERHAVLAEPLTDWETLSAQLRDAQLVQPARVARAGLFFRPWMQAAAALVIAASGAAIGRATATMPLTATGQSAVAATAGSERLAAVSPDSTRTVATVQDALTLMRRAESDYRLAAAFIAVHDTVAGGRSGVDLYRARLAALDRVSDAALAAVNEAPSDPVVNQYLISARSARAVTLQQLNSSLPAGVKLASY